MRPFGGHFAGAVPRCTVVGPHPTMLPCGRHFPGTLPRCTASAPLPAMPALTDFLPPLLRTHRGAMRTPLSHFEKRGCEGRRIVRGLRAYQRKETYSCHFKPM